RPELPADPEPAAKLIVEEYRRHGRKLPGLGHPTHTGGDPRTSRLYELRHETRVAGGAVRLMDAIREEAERGHEKKRPVNATGAIAALATDLGLAWQVTRGLGVMARAVGLVGHLMEEMDRPVARALWEEAETETRPA